MSSVRFSPRFLPAGDSALVVEFGAAVNDAVNDHVLALDAAVAAADLPGVVETVPTYRSLMVVYEPEIASPVALEAALGRLVAGLPHEPAPRKERRFVVPVVYGGEDLDLVAASSGLRVEDVIRLHSAVEYRVHMLGFLPGFAYLGGLDPRLHMPRRPDPRARVPAGSVGIGGTQTGVYSVECPSGWHLLGRTPLRVFDPNRREPFLLAPGDRVRFRPVSPDTWDALVHRARDGDLAPEREEVLA